MFPICSLQTSSPFRVASGASREPPTRDFALYPPYGELSRRPAVVFLTKRKALKRNEWLELLSYFMFWNTQESSYRDPRISASEENHSFHSITKHPKELNLDSYMLVQFCSWFQFHVPLFKSHALLYTTIDKKKGQYNIFYIQGLH